MLPLATGAGDRRICVEVPASAVPGRGRQVERMGSSFSHMVWTIFGGALPETYKHVDGHRNDSATILDLALTSLRFDAGLLRNTSTELYQVLIMLTRGRAQRLVLKAADPEESGSVSTSLRRLNQFQLSRQFRNLWICWQQRLVMTPTSTTMEEL